MESKLYFLATKVIVCLLILKRSVARLLLTVAAVWNNITMSSCTHD